jgi:predicted exporter
MNDEIKASESLASKLNNLGVAPTYFIVEGNDGIEVLENEEQLTERLANAEKEGLVKAYLATSNIIPPKKYRIEHYVTFWKLFFKKWSLLNKFFENKSVLIKPNVRDYLTEIGVENDSAFVASLDLSNNITMIRSFENDSLPQTLRSILQMLWIGHVGDKYYSAVLPLHVSDKFDAQKIAEGLPNVYAVNKVKNINHALTKISHVSLKLVGVAYAVVFLILVIVYKFKDAVRIIRAPVLASLFAASIFGYIGIDFNFFAIVGVILTLGIGIDYALFFKEGGRSNLTTALAIMLSAATTLISFGGLVCSAFVPVHTFGLAVLLGISCCFLLSPLSGKC